MTGMSTALNQLCKAWSITIVDAFIDFLRFCSCIKEVMLFKKLFAYKQCFGLNMKLRFYPLESSVILVGEYTCYDYRFFIQYDMNYKQKLSFGFSPL